MLQKSSLIGVFDLSLSQNVVFRISLNVSGLELKKWKLEFWQGLLLPEADDKSRYSVPVHFFTWMPINSCPCLWKNEKLIFGFRQKRLKADEPKRHEPKLGRHTQVVRFLIRCWFCLILSRVKSYKSWLNSVRYCMKQLQLYSKPTLVAFLSKKFSRKIVHVSHSGFNVHCAAVKSKLVRMNI